MANGAILLYSTNKLSKLIYVKANSVSYCRIDNALLFKLEWIKLQINFGNGSKENLVNRKNNHSKQ